MLQDIAPYVLNNAFLPGSELPPDGESLLLVREGTGLWCRTDGEKLILPKVSAFLRKGMNPTYLIAVGKVRFYMAEGIPSSELSSSGFGLTDAKTLRYISPSWLRYAALTAWQVAGWYLDNVFCGRCGAPLLRDRKERMVKCPECGKALYPKLCPVVIAGVIRGDEILLTKYAGRGSYAKYALVAGFAEVGETIEETVLREVREETGLGVKNLRYYKSQPWAYSESLLLGFYCEAEEGEARADGEEIAEAVWTRREDVPVYDGEISLTYEMMNAFREGDLITRFNR